MIGQPKGSKDQLRSRDGAPVMTVETCDYLRIHRTTIYRLIKSGKIPHFRIGSDYRFSREAIDEWMKDRGSPTMH
jgi:excisionase family DNA binding protein